jgi:dephospho-CoA kinase
MLTIGLTGGIGSGKSTVTKFFRDRHVPVIDADEIVHAIVQPKQPTLELLRRQFGNQIIAIDGSLDRPVLREIIFNDSDKKILLESILHPIIYKKMFEELASHTSAYGILSIPLLVETNHLTEIDRVLVVDCPESTQKKRVKARGDLTNEMIDSIMCSQCSRDIRLAEADDIIENNGTLKELERDVQKLHEFYLDIAADKNI